MVTESHSVYTIAHAEDICECEGREILEEGIDVSATIDDKRNPAPRSDALPA